MRYKTFQEWNELTILILFEVVYQLLLPTALLFYLFPRFKHEINNSLHLTFSAHVNCDVFYFVLHLLS